MKPLFTLSLDRDLPIIVDAILHRRLQMFERFSGEKSVTCLYTSPCAIGVVLPEELRARLDGYAGNTIGQEVMDDYYAERDQDEASPSLDTDIDTLLTYNIISEGDDDERDWKRMQLLHDAIVSHKSTLAVDENKLPYNVEDRVKMTREAIRSFFRFIREQIAEHKLRNTFPQGD